MNKIILQINVSLNYGSTGRIVEDIGKLLIERGDTSYAAYGRQITSSVSHQIRIGTTIEVNIHAIATRIFDKHGFGSRIGTLRFIEKVKKINPDIIHLHNIHGYYLNFEMLFNFIREFGKPVIWTFHDSWPFTGHCTFFNSVNCEKWKTGCYACPLKHDYPKSLFIDNSINNYKLKKQAFTGIKNLTITSVSNWLSTVIKDSFMEQYPINVIYNGLDTEVFAPLQNLNTKKKYQIEDKYVILGVANKWGERKGLLDFHRLSKMIDVDSIILLVGLMEHQIKDLPRNMIGISKTENIQELADLYASADIFINPSRAETFGMVTTEAMACGTPVVAYNNTANPEIVTEDVGMLVETGNIGALYTAMQIIRRNTKKFYTENCRSKVLLYFDKKNNFSEYLKLYDKLLS